MKNFKIFLLAGLLAYSAGQHKIQAQEKKDNHPKIPPEFADYKAQQQKNFEEYKAKQQKAFEDYKAQKQKEFDNYKSESQRRIDSIKNKGKTYVITEEDFKKAKSPNESETIGYDELILEESQNSDLNSDVFVKALVDAKIPQDKALTFSNGLVKRVENDYLSTNAIFGAMEEADFSKAEATAYVKSFNSLIAKGNANEVIEIYDHSTIINGNVVEEENKVTVKNKDSKIRTVQEGDVTSIYGFDTDGSFIVRTQGSISLSDFKEPPLHTSYVDGKTIYECGGIKGRDYNSVKSLMLNKATQTYVGLGIYKDMLSRQNQGETLSKQELEYMNGYKQNLKDLNLSYSNGKIISHGTETVQPTRERR